MSSCTVKLQEILLPSNEDFEDAQALFFRRDLSRESCLDRIIPEQKRWDFIIRNGEKIPLSDEVTDAVKASIPPETSGVEYDKQSNSVFIPAGDLADFSCYLNMFSASKWHKLTYAGDVTLNLELQGTGAVHVLAYRVSPLATQQDIMNYLDYRNELFYMKTGREKPVEEGLRHLHSEVIKSIAFKQEERTVISIPVGQQSATLLGFVVEGIGASVRVFGGNWSASVERDQKRDVDLCLVTTTFQKEQYITHNIELLESMLAGNAELSEHFQIIVVDNGRTLNAADLESNHVRVYPNINVGGAGGFARGMMETLKLEKRPSHVLIMDDDVLVLPESIERTYALLSLLRPAYWDYYLSGAMLRMEEKTVQHEDIGHVSKYGFFEEYKMDDAEVAIVVIGSSAGTGKEAVDRLRAEGQKVGLIKLRVFRPFPRIPRAEAMCKVKAVAVMDRAESFSNSGGPLFNECRSSLYDLDNKPYCINYIYGLGGRDIQVEDFYEIYKDLFVIYENDDPGDVYRYMGVRDSRFL